MMTKNRYERQERFFGKAGQEILKNLRVTVVGVGGVGSHVVQQLAYLGVGSIYLIDADVLSDSNRNRLIGSLDNQPEGMHKTEILEKLINLINSEVKVRSVCDVIESNDALDLITQSDFVFSCFDNDGPRSFINDIVQAHEKPCLDLATGIHTDPLEYGGRIIFIDGTGCLVCMDELDQEEIRVYNENQNQKFDRQEIYGIDKKQLNDSGPSVVSINGVVASLAVTEFMLFVTGIRAPYKHLKYNSKLGIVTKDTTQPVSGCYFCNSHRGSALK